MQVAEVAARFFTQRWVKVGHGLLIGHHLSDLIHLVPLLSQAAANHAPIVAALLAQKADPYVDLRPLTICMLACVFVCSPCAYVCVFIRPRARTCVHVHVHVCLHAFVFTRFEVY